MTRERLDRLSSLSYQLDKVSEMQALFNAHLSGEPSPESDRSAVNVLICGGNYNPSPAFWTKAREMLADDIDKRRAELKVAFENA